MDTKTTASTKATAPEPCSEREPEVTKEERRRHRARVWPALEKMVLPIMAERGLDVATAPWLDVARIVTGLTRSMADDHGLDCLRYFRGRRFTEYLRRAK